MNRPWTINSPDSAALRPVACTSDSGTMMAVGESMRNSTS